MGDVYLAATTGIEGAERACVVKTVRRDHVHDGSFLARFLDEARVQAQLNHPGVAQVLEAATDENGEPYTVVEYVEGRSLADVRQRAVQLGARIGWPEAVALIIEMGQALSHVHERAATDGSPLGIVHRDLSPQNVMVGYAGELKLIDFGTARGQNRRCHTVAGVVFAKPGYVAPEVARQQVGDARIDVYAMGVMLWELCAGKRLLSGEPQKHLEEVAAGNFHIPELVPIRGIPKALDEIIQKLCANDPDDRYVSAGVAASELAKVLATAPAGKNGERSVRARIAVLMSTLWKDEPARSRAEFARLLRDSRDLRKQTETPAAGQAMEAARKAATEEDPNVLAGTPYRLLDKIGEGASGEVFEAEHMELGRKLAVKVLAPAHASAHDAIERFRREARAIANLSHPNLVHLHDFGKSLDGRIFIAMELLKGHTLDKREDKVISWQKAAKIGIDVLRALQVAHAAGIVHRDLKPQNLFITEQGQLKLLDFGVAMATGESAADEGSERQKGFAVFGTPEYMAPEQVAGETIDCRCDLYALGCVLYELVTGAPPFDGSSSVVVMGKQLRETPVPPHVRANGREIPDAIEGVIMRAIRKSPSTRYSHALEMKKALEDALLAPEKRRTRARRIAALVTASACAVLLSAGYKQYGRTQTADIPVVSVDSLPTAPRAESPPPAGEPAPKEPSAETAGNTPAATIPANAGNGGNAAPPVMAPAAPPPTGAPALTPPDSLAASDSDSNATGAETVHPPQPTPPKGLDRATLREHVRPAHPHESRRQHGHSKDDPKAPRGKKSDDTQF
jgi:serine/threonine-protein kinase